jgi:AbrB family looped-hinge helix DNA binding protein
VRHSTVTSKGQTTIPQEIRRLLNIKPGDRLVYVVEDSDIVRIKVQHRTMALKGRLASDKGKDLTFAEIRKAAASSLYP